MTALFFLCLVGLFLGARQLLRLPFAPIPIFVFSSLILVLYCFGLIGYLRPGWYFVSALGFACMGTALVRPSWRAGLADTLRDPAFGIFCLYVVFFLIKFQGGYYYDLNNDDGRHWIPALEEIYRADALRTEGTRIMRAHLDYPCAAALFDYFVLRYTGYGPPQAFFTQSLLLVGPLCLLAWNIARRHWSWGIVLLACYFLLVFNLSWDRGIGYYVLQVDPMIGAWFGAALLLRIKKPGLSMTTFILAAPMLAVLPLFKKPGMFFAIITLIVLYFDAFVLLLARPRAKKMPQVFACLVAVSLLPFLAKLSWDGYTAGHGLKPTFQVSQDLSKLASSFSSTASAREKYTIQRFLKAFIDDDTSINRNGTISHLDFFIFSCISFGLIALYFKRPQNVLKTLGEFTILHCGAVVYLLGVLILYLYFFTDFEIQVMSGLTRYTSAYILAILLLLLAYAFEFLPLAGSRGLAARLYIYCIAILGVYSSSPQTWAFIYKALPAGP
jgi:hypothetical protein